jgi:phage-related protein
MPRKKKAPSAAPAPKLARVAKGKRPQYFSDPAIDKLLAMTLTIMEELAVTRDRLDTVERLLERKKVVRVRDIEQYVARGEAAAQRAARRTAYVERVMRVVQAELEELTGEDMPRTEEEVVAAVAS